PPPPKPLLHPVPPPSSPPFPYTTLFRSVALHALGDHLLHLLPGLLDGPVAEDHLLHPRRQGVAVGVQAPGEGVGARHLLQVAVGEVLRGVDGLHRQARQRLGRTQFLGVPGPACGPGLLGGLEPVAEFELHFCSVSAPAARWAVSLRWASTSSATNSSAAP